MIKSTATGGYVPAGRPMPFRGDHKQEKIQDEPGDQFIPVTLNLQASMVEDPRIVAVEKSTVKRILEQDRFLVKDETGTGFTEEEKQAILSGKDTTFNARLNVCVHATKVVEYFEEKLGWNFKWPSKYFSHYLGQSEKAKTLLESENLTDDKKERLQGFIDDLSRTTGRTDDTKVFINIAPGEGSSMPSFNPAKLQINLTPYQSRSNKITMLHPHRETDAVAHETGHLANACIRPAWDEAKYSFDADLETCALREAFADLSAMFHAFDDVETCRLALDETGGNLDKENRISRLSEEGGSDLLDSYFNKQGVSQDKRYLRSLINDYVYTEPEKANPLIMGTPNCGELFREPYSYSQIFSGSLYDCVNDLYKKESAEKGGSPELLKETAGKVGAVFARAVEIAPWWKPDLKDMAKCVLSAEIMDNKGENLQLYIDAFTRRNLISPEDVKNLQDKLKNPPAVNLREIPSDVESAGKFLAEKGLYTEGAGASCVLADRHTNRAGETFVTYTFEKDSSKDPSETPFDMSVAIMGDICDLTPCLKDRSALVMKFDGEGRLVYCQSEDYHTSDMAQNYLKLNLNPGEG